MPTQHICFGCNKVCSCGSLFAWQCQLCCACQKLADTLFLVHTASTEGAPSELPDVAWPDLDPDNTLAFVDPVDEWLNRR